MSIRSFTTLGLALCVAALLPGPVSAADGDAPYYELSLEKARRLHDLYTLLEQAEILQAMNEVDARIRNSACAREYQEVSESTAELRYMDQRRNSGDPAQRLSRDERAWYNEQARRRVKGLNDFNACYQQYVDGNASGIFPSGVRSHAAAVQHTQHLEHTYRDFDFQDARLEQTMSDARDEIEQIENEPAFIAKLTKIAGAVEIRGRGGWRAAQPGRALLQDEEVRTGSRGLAEIELYDYDPDDDKGPTVLTLAPDSHLALQQFAVTLEREKRAAESQTVLTRAVRLLRGSIRALTRAWGSGSLFSVRAGTTICGSRATYFVVEYNPVSDEGRFELIEGIIDVTNSRGEMHTLRPGQSVRVVNNQFMFGGGLPQ